MTERLYYTDPYARRFDATVQRVVRPDDGTGRTRVFLDRTAFYPTSGGQPFDTGLLGGLRVVDVIDEYDGSIAHIVEGEIAPGQSVHGDIDWERRFDHMQQHTGQHVLSAACDRLFNVRTVSFHLGADVSTIDLARELTPEEIAAAESEANRVVWEDRPVGIRFASKEEAAAMPLRKESLRDGTLRLIDVENWDLSACGGTHVARTGAIGVIAIAAWERFKGGQRLEFLCGGRALARFGAMRDVLAATVRLLSVAPQELPGIVERMRIEGKEQKRAMVALESELARFRAEELWATGTVTPAGRFVTAKLEADANGLKTIASALVARPGTIAALASTASPTLVVVARSADLTAISAQQAVSSLVTTFGGRGGGKPDLAQAGGLQGSVDAILAAARALLVV